MARIYVTRQKRQEIDQVQWHRYADFHTKSTANPMDSPFVLASCILHILCFLPYGRDVVLVTGRKSLTWNGMAGTNKRGLATEDHG
jgi:hypothetical protein